MSVRANAEDLRLFLKKMGWSQYEADRRANATLGRTANYLRHNGPKPPTEYLDALAKSAGYTMSWKELFLDAQSRPDIAPATQAALNYHDLPFAGDVPAGEWGDPLESTERVAVWAEVYNAKNFAARAVGESCYPAILQGDLLIFRSDKAPPYGKIVLAQKLDDHKCTVKELRFDRAEKRPVLRSINPFTNDPNEDGGWYAIARLIGLERDVDGAKMRFYSADGLTQRQLMFGRESELTEA